MQPAYGQRVAPKIKPTVVVVALRRQMCNNQKNTHRLTLVEGTPRTGVAEEWHSEKCNNKMKVLSFRLVRWKPHHYQKGYEFHKEQGSCRVTNSTPITGVHALRVQTMAVNETNSFNNCILMSVCKSMRWHSPTNFGRPDNEQ